MRYSFLRHFRLRHWLLCKPRDASCEQHRAGVKDGGNTGWRAVARAAAWLTEGVEVWAAEPDEDVGGFFFGWRAEEDEWMGSWVATLDGNAMGGRDCRGVVLTLNLWIVRAEGAS